MHAENDNPALSPLVRVLFVGIALVLSVGAGLLLLPDVVIPRWIWPITPFNARFLGAVYLSEMSVALILLLVNRWSPGRLILPMALLFVAVVTAVSLIHFARFDPNRRATWAWFAVYLIPLAAIGCFLVKHRRLSTVSGLKLPVYWRSLLTIEAAFLGSYGLGLLLLPETFAAFWPWPLDRFHAQMYSALFFTLALGAFLLQRSVTALELLTLGVAQGVLGVAAIGGLLALNALVNRVDGSLPGTWLWLGLFALLAAVGAALLLQARRMNVSSALLSAA